MKLIVNGEAQDYAGDPFLAAFLGQQGVAPARVAVLVNDEIVPHRERERHPLHEGDRVEILIFAGGG